MFKLNRLHDLLLTATLAATLMLSACSGENKQNDNEDNKPDDIYETIMTVLRAVAPYHPIRYTISSPKHTTSWGRNSLPSSITRKSCRPTSSSRSGPLYIITPATSCPSSLHAKATSSTPSTSLQKAMRRLATTKLRRDGTGRPSCFMTSAIVR